MTKTKTKTKTETEAAPGSGYVDCACPTCFEITVGYPGDMCHDCEEAGCDGTGECEYSEGDRP